MQINEIVKESYSLALRKGWWDTDRGLPETVMMVITELAEAVQEHRTNGNSSKFKEEIADSFIRLFDLCGRYNIDIQSEIQKKHNKNVKRAYRHNKKY